MKRDFHSIVVFRFSLLLLVIMSGASSLTKVATYRLPKNIALMVAQGSVLDFGHPRGAIVNAANEGCLGGGGVDGAITTAGGEALAKDRLALPCSRGGIRCPTGQARITGPNTYGTLQVPYVIHAVGPNYMEYDTDNDDNTSNHGFDEPDSLLRSAYQASMECCRQASNPPIETVAFSLLSAGVYRGNRDVKTILRLGVCGIRDWIYESEDCGALQEVTLCGFSTKEVDALLEVCVQELR